MTIPIEFDTFALLPLLALIATSLLVMLAEAFIKTSERISYWMSICGLSVSIISSFATVSISGTILQDMINVGGVGSIFSAMFGVSALGTVILARDYLQKEGAHYGEFYLLILFSTVGMVMMATAADLIVIFLGLELMSICLYVLAGYMRKRALSNESALKYFLLGSFATGFLLYGIALLYGAAGSTKIAFLINNYSAISASPFFWIGLGLLFIGLAFKVGGVPFHMWIPDVYQGAPTPVSGFMSTGAKAAAFSALLIVFITSDISRGDGVEKMIAIVAALSMIVGNIIAISQANLKRMLAYSSIAHAGYMLAGVAANNQMGKSGVIFYLFSYTFMNLGAFGLLSIAEKGEKNLTYDDYAGLGFRHPLLAALMSMFLFSLAGIPPFAGFFGKYYVFVAAIDAGLTWLAILGVLMSVVSVYYYLRLIVFMYFREGEEKIPVHASTAGYAVIILCALGILVLGIYPSALLSLITPF